MPIILSNLASLGRILEGKLDFGLKLSAVGSMLTLRTIPFIFVAFLLRCKNQIKTLAADHMDLCRENKLYISCLFDRDLRVFRVFFRFVFFFFSSSVLSVHVEQQQFKSSIILAESFYGGWGKIRGYFVVWFWQVGRFAGLTTWDLS